MFHLIQFPIFQWQGSRWILPECPLFRALDSQVYKSVGRKRVHERETGFALRVWKTESVRSIRIYENRILVQVLGQRGSGMLLRYSFLQESNVFLVQLKGSAKISFPRSALHISWSFCTNETTVFSSDLDARICRCL